MIIDVKVPMLSESVSEGTLLEWKKKVGEAVARDEILIDIETDKVVLEVPSPQAGVLVEIVAQDGETVVADQVLHASIPLLLPPLKHLQPLLPKLPRLPLLLLHKTTPRCLPPPNWLPRPVLT